MILKSVKSFLPISQKGNFETNYHFDYKNKRLTYVKPCKVCRSKIQGDLLMNFASHSNNDKNCQHNTEK